MFRFLHILWTTIKDYFRGVENNYLNGIAYIKGNKIRLNVVGKLHKTTQHTIREFITNPEFEDVSYQLSVPIGEAFDEETEEIQYIYIDFYGILKHKDIKKELRRLNKLEKKKQKGSKNENS